MDMVWMLWAVVIFVFFWIAFAQGGEEDAEHVRNFAESKIYEIGQSREREDYSPVEAIIGTTFARMEELSKLKPGEVPGLTTGFKELDRLTLGLQKSSLIILAARPSQGKTSLAINIAINAALKKNAVITVFSIEMSKEDLMQRMLSTQAGIELTQLRNGQAIKDTDKATRLGEVAQELAGTNIYIDDTSSVQISEIRSKCRQIRSNNNGRMDLVIVDYLQLMDVGASARSSSRPENRQQEISTLTRMLKQLAREMACPVLVLSQLSRNVEHRKDNRPVLSDLRDSGAIEQDADVVMFIYQAEDRDGTGPDSALTKQISIAKNRNGEIGEITLRWLGDFTKFANYDRSADWLVNIDDADSDDGAFLIEE